MRICIYTYMCMCEVYIYITGTNLVSLCLYQCLQHDLDSLGPAVGPVSPLASCLSPLPRHRPHRKTVLVLLRNMSPLFLLFAGPYAEVLRTQHSPGALQDPSQ